MRIAEWDRFADEIVYGRQRELRSIFSSMCVFDSLCNLALANEGKPFNRIIGPNIMFRYGCIDVEKSDIRKYFPVWPESACVIRLEKIGEFIQREFLKNGIQINECPHFQEILVKDTLNINFVEGDFVVGVFGGTESCHATVMTKIEEDFKIIYDPFFFNGISLWEKPSSIIAIA